MSATDTVQPMPASAAAAAGRIVSIDIFRGLTIAVMIFVNELAEVRGLPWWTYHAHGNQDVMTYVDMVFPFFLFIVGMSLPLSVEQRLRKSSSLPLLWLHVILRSVSLLVLGLILANAELAAPAHMPISGDAWALLGLVSAGLYLNVYPRSRRFPRYTTLLRAIGLIGVAFAFVIFRRSAENGRVAWIDPSYPEILGLIALAFFSVALLYIPTRRWRWTAPAWFLLLLVLNIVSTAGVFTMPSHISMYAWPFGNGAHSCLVMAGVVTSQIFFGLHPRGTADPAGKRETLIAIAFALLAIAVGWACVPLGISKIRATPAWTLWNVGAAVLAFTLLYWICDRHHHTAWAFPVRPAGSNTLLTYLLPDLTYYVLGILGVTWLERHFHYGWPGVVKSLLFTIFVLGLSSVLTRAKLRLQL